MLLFSSGHRLYAQNTVIKDSFTVFGPLGVTNFSQNFYVGGAASVFNINGSDAEFRQAGENTCFASAGKLGFTAVNIYGGKFIFDNPSDYTIGTTPLTWTTQKLDGGSSATSAITGATVMGTFGSISANSYVVNRNPNNVSLEALDPTLAGFAADTHHDVYVSGPITDFALTNINSNPITDNDFILNSSHYVTYPPSSINFPVFQNYRQSRFFVTNGTGHLGIIMMDGINVGTPPYSTQNFPVGIAEGDYTPAKLTITGGTFADFAMVNVKTYANPETIEELPAEGIDRVWNIHRLNVPASVYSSATINVDLQHNDVTNGSLYTYNNAFVTRYCGTAPNTDGGATSTTVWDYTGICSTESDNGTLTTDATMTTATELSRTFSTFATTPTDSNSWYTKSVCDASPLPAELLSFTARANDCKVVLTWKTASEVNFNHFDVERKIGNGSYNKLATIEARGSHSTYTYNDGINDKEVSYRLVMFDNDGSKEYSSVVFVGNACMNRIVGSVNVYPNPTNISNGFIIDYTSEELVRNAQVVMYDALGKEIYNEGINIEIGTVSTSISTNALSQGVYTVLIRKGKEVISKPIRVFIIE